MEDYTNKIARLFQEKFNLKKGDCVALFLEYKPEYIGIWLGLSKLGVITALINTNLRNESLTHVGFLFIRSYVLIPAHPVQYYKVLFV